MTAKIDPNGSNHPVTSEIGPSGKKYDQGKPAWHLIDPEFMRAVALRKDPDVAHSVLGALASWTKPGEGEECIAEAYHRAAQMYGTRDPRYTARIELARVLEFGGRKYSPNNWRLGFAWSRLYRAAWGHIESHRSGQLYDEESGLMHLSHSLTMLMFLWVHQKQGLGTDDRAEAFGTTLPTP